AYPGFSEGFVPESPRHLPGLATSPNLGTGVRVGRLVFPAPAIDVGTHSCLHLQRAQMPGMGPARLSRAHRTGAGGTRCRLHRAAGSRRRLTIAGSEPG